jgi:hypothetical protein
METSPPIKPAVYFTRSSKNKPWSKTADSKKALSGDEVLPSTSKGPTGKKNRGKACQNLNRMIWGGGEPPIWMLIYIATNGECS